jgi:N4-gp56 family major capsid protein
VTYSRLATNVIYATGGADTASARVDMDVDDTLTAQDVRRAVAQLRGANVPTINGNYVGFIHPDVQFDLVVGYRCFRLA